MMTRKLVLAFAACLFCSCAFAQKYSAGPRQTGEEILEELMVGKNTLVIKVGSGGCTSKRSYRIDVKKTEGVTSLVPHYILTINRVQIDECKAIVDDGPVIMWDFEKDLGLKGMFTVSVQNMVDAVQNPNITDEKENSMLSTVKKHVDIEGAASETGQQK